MFNHLNACPVVSYSITTKGPFYRNYTGTDITINSNNQIKVMTGTSISKNLYVKVNTKSDYEIVVPFTVHVCGLETMSLNNKDLAIMNFKFGQGTGGNNITSRYLYEDINKMNIARSSNPGCPVQRHELFYYNTTLKQIMPYTGTTLKINYQTGFMKFNTTLPADEELILRINSLNGKKPVEISLQVVVVKKPIFEYNAKPILREPPTGANLVVRKDQKV